MELHDALAARRSVRAFLPRDVPRELLVEIFADAQRAPSWCNIQPWRIALFSGAARVRLVETLTAAATRGGLHTDFDWPTGYPEPYGTHRKECGKALYSAMGVARDDHSGRQQAWMRNFAAFDAPHVGLVGLDRRLGIYAALDVGCWLQSVLLAATARGVASCAQASLATFSNDARPLCGWDEHIGLLFGVALGYEDTGAKANATRTTRAALGENVRFVD